MTRKHYKSSILDKQPGHLQKQHLRNGACCIHTQSTHHKKAKLIFPKHEQPMLLLFFYKIYPRPEVEEHGFPQKW